MGRWRGCGSWRRRRKRKRRRKRRSGARLSGQGPAATGAPPLPKVGQGKPRIVNLQSFRAEHIESAAGLLAARHRRDLAANPRLPARFSEPVHARPAITQHETDSREPRICVVGFDRTAVVNPVIRIGGINLLAIAVCWRLCPLAGLVLFPCPADPAVYVFDFFRNRGKLNF